jgi:hypothetical protein
LMRATAMCLPFDEDLIRGARKWVYYKI